MKKEGDFFLNKKNESNNATKYFYTFVLFNVIYIILDMITNYKKNYLFLLFILFISINSYGQTEEQKFHKLVYNNADGQNLAYRFLLPDNPDISFYAKKAINKLVPTDSIILYPLVIFLHGAGERGNDNEKQLIHGVTLFAQYKMQEKFPCFVIAPQCPEGKRWVEVDWKLDKHQQPDNSSISLQLTMELIDSITQQYPIDTARIYITGLSMGGFGTWDAISRYPNKFAAAAPVCGGGDEQTAHKIKIPVWAFHGTKDKAVKVERSRNMITAMQQNGVSPKYTEYPKLGHFVWGKAYSEELIQWLFDQSK